MLCDDRRRRQPCERRPVPMADAKPPVLCPSDPLREFVAAVAERMGADTDVAAEFGRHLVGSNLAGHDSHGVIRVPQYVGDADQGVTRSLGPSRVRAGRRRGRPRGRPARIRPALDHVRARVGDRASAPARGGDGGGPALDTHRAARRVCRAHGRRGSDRHRDGGGGGRRYRRRRALWRPDALSRDQSLGHLRAGAPAPLHLRRRDVDAGRGQGSRGAGGRKGSPTRRHRGSGRASEP